jgi:hypothetical protein
MEECWNSHSTALFFTVGAIDRSELDNHSNW